MKIHTVLLTVILINAGLPVSLQAETCRAATAAAAGRDAGYEQARRAAEAWADREGAASDILQDCLTGIRDITITLPSFPNLADLINQAINRVCRTAVDKVNNTLPSGLDPWKDLN